MHGPIRATRIHNYWKLINLGIQPPRPKGHNALIWGHSWTGSGRADVVLYPTNDLVEARAGCKDLADSRLLQGRDVFGRYDTAPEHDHVVGPTRPERLNHRREQGVVRSTHDGEANRVDPFLHCRGRDHLGCLVQPRVNDFEASIPERARHYLGAAVVAVEAGFCNQDSNGCRHQARQASAPLGQIQLY